MKLELMQLKVTEGVDICKKPQLFSCLLESNTEKLKKQSSIMSPCSRIINIVLYGAGEGEPEGTVKYAVFTLNGQEYMAMDSNMAHQFTFTPAISIFVTCETEKEIDTLFKALSEGGSVFMELNKYPFSEKFGWVEDKFGISWQLNLVSA